MKEEKQHIQNARLLIARLERLSADSHWAHKASGLRGSLLRSMDQIESSQKSDLPIFHPNEMEHLALLLAAGFEILEKAAREITVPEQGGKTSHLKRFV
jgi:hypothetical protein